MNSAYIETNALEQQLHKLKAIEMEENADILLSEMLEKDAKIKRLEVELERARNFEPKDRLLKGNLLFIPFAISFITFAH